MSLACEELRETATGVEVVDGPGGLAAIARADCAAAIWRRTLDPGLQAWIDGLDAARLPQARAILRPGAVRDAARRICEMSQTPDCAERDALIGDIGALADRFAAIMEAPFLRLRLAAVSTNSCRRFHIDAVTARLICTYRGAGTQYGISRDGEAPATVAAVPTGAPVLLRGTLWPESPRAGLRHRSPPIEGSGETRLVLVLDPMDGPEEAA